MHDRRWRRLTRAILVSGLLLMAAHASGSSVAAQVAAGADDGDQVALAAGTGTLSGRIVFCPTLPRPVGAAAEGDGETGPSLADVTPGGNRRRPAPMIVPAADLRLSVVGTGVTAQTDAAGQFTLSGVPAGQALVVLVDDAPGVPLQLSTPELRVDAGQTRDLGTLGLAPCGQAGAQFVPVAPAPTAEDGSLGDTPPTSDDDPADAP